MEQQQPSTSFQASSSPVDNSGCGPFYEPVNGIVQPSVMPLPAHPGRKTNQLRFLKKKVMSPIWKHLYSRPFRKPVNIIKLQIPDYYKVITNPMDLGTIRKRLKNKFYWSSEECINDFRTMFRNCYTYNDDEQDIVAMAKTLERIFKEKISQMPKLEFELPIKQSGKTGDNAGGSSEPSSAPESSKSSETSWVPESSRSPESSSAPESSRSPESSSAPESSKSPESSSAQESCKSPESSSAQESCKSPESSSAQESCKSPESSSAQESSRSSESFWVIESNTSLETSCVPESRKLSEPFSAPESSKTSECTPNLDYQSPSTSKLRKMDKLEDAKLEARYRILVDSRRTKKGKPQEELSPDLKNCQKILKNLFRKRHSSYVWPFYIPMNAWDWGLDNYFNVITNPMDLLTVKCKMEDRLYANPQGFIDDVKLICSNSYKYNCQRLNLVSRAELLEQIFESMLSKISDGRASELDESSSESSVYSSSGDSNSGSDNEQSTPKPQVDFQS